MSCNRRPTFINHMPKKKIVAKTKKSVAPRKEKEKVVKAPNTPQLLRGMKDILPVEAPYWAWLQDKIDDLANYFCYQYIEPPVLEAKELFVRSVGKQTDIVEKEMYVFVDPGGDNVCLRPEVTASIVRAYINHGMLSLPQPIKLYYSGSMFRHDRPQAGRYRQFHQASFEAIGDEHPVIDAELILVAYSFFQDLGLPVTLQLNSIGCRNCRETYKTELQNYYRSRRSLICDKCKERLQRNPLRLLDCKEPGCELIKESAPQILNYLDESCNNHFFKVIEYLDDMDLPYRLNPYLVRGLDYYNRTVFEIWPDIKDVRKIDENEVRQDGKKEKNSGDETGAKETENKVVLPAQAALGGGGRYDGLVETLGGRPTAGAGFAIGLERVIGRLKELNIAPPQAPTPQVLIAQLGEAARRKALSLHRLLRGQVRVATVFSKDGLKPQLEIANRLGVRYALIIGQKEVLDDTVIIRDMEAGIQEVVAFNKVAADLKRRFSVV